MVVGTHTLTVLDGTYRHWMDATGQPQATATTQTRGVIDQAGRRLWLDVFPTVHPVAPGSSPTPSG